MIKKNGVKAKEKCELRFFFSKCKIQKHAFYAEITDPVGKIVVERGRND